VKTPKWDTGVLILVQLELMNSGKHLTGILPNHLHLRLAHPGMDLSSSNNLVIAMNILSLPTPTAPSKVVVIVLLIAPFRDLTWLTGLSLPDTAIVNTTPWVTSVMTSEMLMHTNFGKLSVMIATTTVNVENKTNLTHTTILMTLMDMLTSSKWVTAMTPLNLPTPTVPSIKDIAAL